LGEAWDLLDRSELRMVSLLLWIFGPYDHTYGFVGPSIAFHAEWPPVMNFASNPRSRSARARLRFSLDECVEVRAVAFRTNVPWNVRHVQL